MVDELTQDFSEDVNEEYERFKFHNGKAERALDRIKMAENDIKPLPEHLADYPEPRDFVEEALNNSLDRIENAFRILDKNTVYKEGENRYDSPEKISEFVYDLDFEESETYINTELLFQELDNYKAVVEYADRNGVDLPSKYFKFHEDSVILESA
jgi:hypothetical protein